MRNIYIRFIPSQCKFYIDVYTGTDDDNLTNELNFELLELDLNKVAAYLMDASIISDTSFKELAEYLGRDKLFLVPEGRYEKTVIDEIHKKYPDFIDFIYEGE